MRPGRVQDSKIHQIIFNQKQDICPKYTTDFHDCAIIYEHLFITSQALSLSIGIDDFYEKYYCELTTETEETAITYRKLADTVCLAICSVAVSYFKTKNRGRRGKDSSD